MKRKIRVFGKVNLYETSAVGLPAYPDAHFNTELSLTKSLSSFINKEAIKYEEETMETEKVLETSEAVTKTEEVQTTEKKVETETVKSEAKEEVKEDLNSLVAKAVKDAFKEAETERALVAQKEAEPKVEKSIGELTLEMFRRDIER